MGNLGLNMTPACLSCLLFIASGGSGIFYANSLAPGRFEWNFRHVIFKQILVIDDWGISCEIALLWMSLDFTADQSTLVQVMAWCRLSTSHYLSQCWPRSLSPYGITRSMCWCHWGPTLSLIWGALTQIWFPSYCNGIDSSSKEGSLDPLD